VLSFCRGGVPVYCVYACKCLHCSSGCVKMFHGNQIVDGSCTDVDLPILLTTMPPCKHKRGTSGSWIHDCSDPAWIASAKSKAHEETISSMKWVKEQLSGIFFQIQIILALNVLEEGERRILFILLFLCAIPLVLGFFHMVNVM